MRDPPYVCNKARYLELEGPANSAAFAVLLKMIWFFDEVFDGIALLPVV